MDLFLRKLLYISVSIILYIASMWLPAYNFADSITHEKLSEFHPLTEGSLTWNLIEQASNPFPFIAWLANIPFIIGFFILVFSKNKKGFSTASIILFVALLMSLGSLIIYTKAGACYSPGIGCFVWIFSLLLMWAGAHFLKRDYTEAAAE